MSVRSPVRTSHAAHRATLLSAGAIVLLALLWIPQAHGQIQNLQLPNGQSIDVAPAPEPEDICTLHPRYDDTGFFLRQDDATLRSHFERPGDQSPSDESITTSSFEITFANSCGGQSWPQAARESFEYAASIWERHLESEVPIRVRAVWSNFGDRPDADQLLGSAGPTRVVRFTGESDDVPVGVWLPVSQASALSGDDVLQTIPDESFDIVANLSCERNDWHFNPNTNPGPGRIDFASVVLHEIGHGIGFLGSMSVPIDDDRQVEEEIASWGLTPGEGEDPLPLVYESFGVDGLTNLLTDTNVYGNPSEALYEALTGQAGGVFFDGPSAALTNEDTNDEARQGEAPTLFSPDPWNAGSSFSHLDQATYTNTANALMRPFFSTQEVLHSPGPIFCGILTDMSWPVGEDCTPFFPPGLANLQVTVDGDQAILTWDSVEDFDAYRIDLATIDGLGEPSFRNVDQVSGGPFQVTLDNLQGSSFVARVVPQDAPERRRSVNFTTTIDQPVLVQGPAPNPFSEEARLAFTVQEEQRVTVRVYNAAAQEVALLYDGDARPGEPVQVSLEDPTLSSGVYFFNLNGREFNVTETAVLVR